MECVAAFIIGYLNGRSVQVYKLNSGKYGHLTLEKVEIYEY